MRRGALAGAAFRLVLPLGLLLALAPCLFGQQDERPTLGVGVLGDTHRIDGILDEPEWASAPPSADLIMVEPRQGERPSGRTVVHVLAGPKALVFGIRCEDPDPSGIVSFTKERDGDFEYEDHVAIVLDPFRDGRSGYVFAVNPGGARFDALVAPGGEGVDANWDGQWEAATSRDASGWTAEIRIPVEILSFGRGHVEWGLNVQRRVQRRQETDRWASPRQDYTVFQTSRAGVLTGLPRFDVGLGRSVRPFIRQMFHELYPSLTTDLGGRWESYRIQVAPVPWGPRCASTSPRTSSSTASCSTTPRTAPSARTPACVGPSTRGATSS